jgi:G8 domain
MNSRIFSFALTFLVSPFCLSGCGNNPDDTLKAQLSVSTTVIDGTAIETVALSSSQIDHTDSSFGSVAMVKARFPSSETSQEKKSLRWSNPATWGGTSPPTDANVTIPFGRVIILDVPSVRLSELKIDGELRVDPLVDVELVADAIEVKGALIAGEGNVPHSGKFTITLKGAVGVTSASGLVNRSLTSVGGKISLVGISPATVWTRIAGHANKGNNEIPVPSTIRWKAGDQIVLAPTDYYGYAKTEMVGIKSSSPGMLLTSKPLEDTHWGVLQYVTQAGIGLVPDGTTSASMNGAPIVLDQRAAIGNLSRNIVIQGANDLLWTTVGHGASVMVMEAKSNTLIDGVELRRVGQAGSLGRYPIHFHQLSYDANGQEIAEKNVRIVRNSSISNSTNRCLVIHGTNYVTLDKNICYDIAGHGIFLEDSVERKNLISNNLVLKVRAPKTPLLSSEKFLGNFGTTGFWISNPDNVVTGNYSADSEANGFWLAFPRKPQGKNKLVKILPDRLPFGKFDDNVAGSNQAVGIMLDVAQVNDAGDVDGNMYMPTVNGAENDYTNWLRFKLARNTTVKNNQTGFWNRVATADYEEWTFADNIGTSVAGAVFNAKISKSLLVGVSANARNTWKNIASEFPPVALASYHSTADIVDNVILNYPLVEGKPSGAFKTDDYYIRAVDRGLSRNSNNKLVQSSPGYRSLPIQVGKWELAGALWDPFGYWGPKGSYWVFDEPFFTAENRCELVAPTGKNGASCFGEFFGVGEFVVDYSDRNGISPLSGVQRLGSNGAVIGQWPSVGVVVSPAGPRHFAAKNDGIYAISLGSALPKQEVVAVVENLVRNTDAVVLSFPFDGAVDVEGYYTKVWNYRTTIDDPSWRVPMVKAASYEEMIASNGKMFWQDKSKNKVWLRAMNLFTPLAVDVVQNRDQLLYKPIYVRFAAK